MITLKTNRQRGATMALVLVAMTGLCGMAALSIDVATVCVARQQLQTAADAAALAGAGRLRTGADPSAARLAAQMVAESNEVLGDGATLNVSTDVIIGDYDAETQAVSATWSGDQLPVVTVTVRRAAGSPDGALPLAFSRMFGVGSVDVQATAVAAVGSMNGFSGRAPLEIIIVQDGSYSFRQEMDDAKQADSSLVDIISDGAVNGDRVALINFAGSAWCERDFGDLPDDLASINSAIMAGDYCDTYDKVSLNQDRYYGTDTGAAIDEAMDIFYEQGAAYAEQVIVLVSDGMPYPDARRPLAVQAADRAAARGIRIHTVTFDQEGDSVYGSDGADVEFNASLTRNGGYSFHTPDETKLTPILGKIGAIEIGRPHLIR